MIIRKMRSYFLYNVPVTEHMMTGDEHPSIGVTPTLLERLQQNFTVEPTAVPAFYTQHYRQEHTPHLVRDGVNPTTTQIDHNLINSIDFFARLNLTHAITVNWEFMLALQTTGLITICLEMDEPQDSSQAYRLSGLHLNPAYKVIDTAPIAYLWSHDPSARPDLITLDDLAYAIHHHFFHNAGINVRRFRALRHEIQIPFTAVEVGTDTADQGEFIAENEKALAELVFKPACWEVEHASASHARLVLDESRTWSVAQDTYVITAYEGAVYVKIKSFDTGVPHENAGFYLADERSVLFSFQVAVSNYHLLRILDDHLDDELGRLKKQVASYQYNLRHSFDNVGITQDENILREMNDFVIRVTNLEFDLRDLMEELDNPDKLIDEEWHIVLLDKLNHAFGLRAWRDSMNDRVNNLRQLVETVENTYQRLLDLKLNRTILELTLEEQRSEERDKRVGYLFGVFAVSELLGLLIGVGLDDQNPMARAFMRIFNITLMASHLLSVITVILIIGILLIAVRWFVNREPTGGDPILSKAKELHASRKQQKNFLKDPP